MDSLKIKDFYATKFTTNNLNFLRNWLTKIYLALTWSGLSNICIFDGMRHFFFTSDTIDILYLFFFKFCSKKISKVHKRTINKFMAFEYK